MQKRYIGSILGILIFIVLISGYILIIGHLANITKVNMANDTYSGDGVSFNIPANWQVSKVMDGSNINIDISKNNSNNKIIIAISPNPKNMSNQDLINTIQYPSNPSGWQKISNSTLTVDGNTAYENIYTVNDSSQFTEIMTDEQINFIKNGYTYALDFQAPINDFNNEKSNFNITLNSFKVQ